MRSGILSLFGLSIFIATAVAFGADIYVSPTGSDAADGLTPSTPLATLTAARTMADVQKAGNTPVTVWLRGGTYYLTAPMAFGVTNSGSAGAPITYKRYQNEKPIISGGIKVPSTAVWNTYSGSIMVTTITTGLKVDQLFLNGQRQILARYPNFIASTPTKVDTLDGYAADCISATRVARWANVAEGPGYFRALHNSLWGGNSYVMTSKSGTTLNYTWRGDNNRGNTPHTTYRMVENLFEELDAVGEWFYRKSTGQLFFWPPAGTNLSTATVELASQDELIHIAGTSNATAGSVKYLTFDGLTFTQTYRTLFSPSKTYETVFQADWAIVRSGTVFMQDAENITIQNCQFDQIGGNGVFMSGYNQHHVIYNNVFNGAGASCVCLFGLNSSVRCPNSYSTTPTCTDKTPGPLTNEYPSYITVSNNMMANLGRFEKQPAGIALSATEFDTLRHNTIHDCPRAGICFLDGCWGGNVVEFNWIYNSIQETGDHGPLNAWGRDRIQRFQTDTTWAKLDARNTTTIRNNRFEAPAGDFGIDMDDQATNYLQYNNLLFGGGLKLQWNRYNTYLNNILAKGATVQFHGTWAHSDHYAARNVITGFALYGECCWTGNHIPDSLKAHIRQFDSNVVYQPTGGLPFLAPWGGTNSEYTWAQWQTAGLDVHSKTTDPMFTDTNKTVWPNPNYLPKGDYTVKTGSPALTLGFQNFPMDSFGVMGTPGTTTAVQYPIMRKTGGTENDGFNFHYSAGRLSVSHEGDYQVTITTALGRTLRVFRGKGSSSFKIDATPMGAGMYFAVIRAGSGVATHRFIVN